MNDVSFRWSSLKTDSEFIVKGGVFDRLLVEVAVHSGEYLFIYIFTLQLQYVQCLWNNTGAILCLHA